MIRICSFAAILLIAFSLPLQAEDRVPIDQEPMYGGFDRKSIQKLREGDEKLIADTTMHYGTRQMASTAFVDNGFSYYMRDDLPNAMRRFNQAWLLDPSNPNVYAGFGSVLHDQGKNCKAMEMMEKAIALDPPTHQGIYPDAARLVVLCAVSNIELGTKKRARLIARSESLYKKAEKVENNTTYVYESWATAYYWSGKYPEAWQMVSKARAAGGHHSEKFLGLLRDKMAEPANQ